MKKTILKNLLLIPPFIIETLALIFWYRDILSITLWGMQDVEFKQEDVDLYYSIFNVFLFCGIIILAYLIISSLLSLFTYKAKSKKASNTIAITEFVLGVIVFVTIIINFVLGYIKCEPNLTLQESFFYLSLPLIIVAIALILFNVISIMEFIEKIMD